MLEKNVHRFPQRVVKNFDQLLMLERMGKRGEGEGHGAALPRPCECGLNFGIAFGRAESHHHVAGAKDRFEPGAKRARQIERGKRTLADDDRVHELYRDVLRIGRVRTAAEGEQAAAAQESLRHFTACRGQPIRFAIEEVLENAVAFQELRGNVIRDADHQQILGSGSPTSMSITRLPP